MDPVAIAFLAIGGAVMVFYMVLGWMIYQRGKETDEIGRETVRLRSELEERKRELEQIKQRHAEWSA